MIFRQLKHTIVRAANFCGVDRLFRHINRKKLLVVMYHGVTPNDYTPPIWTQLPLKTFRQQIKYLSEHYVPVSLTEVAGATRGVSALPEHAVLITFDDGLRNNYSAAFPVLQESNVPAAIFLTIDFIGSDEILWFDELFFLLKEAAGRGATPDMLDAAARNLLLRGKVWDSYVIAVETLKRVGKATRTLEMAKLRAFLPLDRQKLLEDFGMLSWDEVRTMQQSGLVEFGVHTATHRILTELVDDEWDHEIIVPKHILEEKLHTEAAAFCFPNGKPQIDFCPDQLAALRMAGYSCAFTTENALFDWTGGEKMAIGRIPAGNDATSDSSYFRLNASGALYFVRDMVQRWLRITNRATGAET